MDKMPYAEISFGEFIADIDVELEREVKRFLGILPHAPFHFVAPHAIQDVMEAVQGCPALLGQVEEALGGRLVCYPALTAEAILEGYRRTLMLYRAAYGQPPTRIWDDPRPLSNGKRATVLRLPVFGLIWCLRPFQPPIGDRSVA